MFGSHTHTHTCAPLIMLQKGHCAAAEVAAGPSAAAAPCLPAVRLPTGPRHQQAAEPSPGGVAAFPGPTQTSEHKVSTRSHQYAQIDSKYEQSSHRVKI